VATLNDVVEFAKQKSYISVESVAEEFSLPEMKACRILLLCFERGLLLPTNKSYFTTPVEDGVVPVFTPGKRKNARTEPALQILTFFMANDDMALTANEVEAHFGLSRNLTRGILRELTASGGLKRLQAEKGGAYGNPPMIYGLSEEAIALKEQEVIAKHQVSRKEAMKKRKQTLAKKRRKEAKDDLEPHLRVEKSTARGTRTRKVGSKIKVDLTDPYE